MLGNPLFPGGALEFHIKEPHEQMRTPCDVKLRWVRPRVPSKRAGRRGTRRAWKRRNPPHWIYTYREPLDALQFGRILIVTSRQYEAIKSHPSVRNLTPPAP